MADLSHFHWPFSSAFGPHYALIHANFLLLDVSYLSSILLVAAIARQDCLPQGSGFYRVCLSRERMLDNISVA
jgi:hypothetical protein